MGGSVDTPPAWAKPGPDPGAWSPSAHVSLLVKKPPSARRTMARLIATIKAIATGPPDSRPQGNRLLLVITAAADHKPQQGVALGLITPAPALTRRQASRPSRNRPPASGNNCNLVTCSAPSAGVMFQPIHRLTRVKQLPPSRERNDRQDSPPKRWMQAASSGEICPGAQRVSAPMGHWGRSPSRRWNWPGGEIGRQRQLQSRRLPGAPTGRCPQNPCHTPGCWRRNSKEEVLSQGKGKHHRE